MNSYKVNLGLQKNRNEYNLQDGDHVIPIDPKKWLPTLILFSIVLASLMQINVKYIITLSFRLFALVL